MNLIRNPKFLFFMGGVTAAVAGKLFLTSKTAHNLAVKGLAAGMKAQKDAMEKLTNIKEEATDLYLDSVKETE